MCSERADESLSRSLESEVEAQPDASEVAEEIVAELRAVAARFEGPLPPPGFLRGYEEVIPGAAERILRMAEAQSEHRRTIEAKVIDSDIARSGLGLWLGALVALAFMAAAVMMVLSGHPIPGTILGTADLGVVVGTFIYGTRIRSQQLREREMAGDE